MPQLSRLGVLPALIKQDEQSREQTSAHVDYFGTARVETASQHVERLVDGLDVFAQEDSQKGVNILRHYDVPFLHVVIANGLLALHAQLDEELVVVLQ